MSHLALSAGRPFPQQRITTLGGTAITLGVPSQGFDWQMIVVYRGAHCPLCTRYLGEINQLLGQFHQLGIEVVAVSADPIGKARQQTAEIRPQFPVGYGLTLSQMHQMGLYVSTPRSPEETDAPFAEPGLFVINQQGALQLVDTSNAPFARPDLRSLLMGLGFIKNPENHYPIRGTHA